MAGSETWVGDPRAAETRAKAAASLSSILASLSSHLVLFLSARTPDEGASPACASARASLLDSRKARSARASEAWASSRSATCPAGRKTHRIAPACSPPAHNPSSSTLSSPTAQFLENVPNSARVTSTETFPIPPEVLWTSVKVPKRSPWSLPYT